MYQVQYRQEVQMQQLQKLEVAHGHSRPLIMVILAQQQLVPEY